MAKETRLDDSAEIYAKREKKTEREKMKDMSFKEKLNYFNTYYLKILIVGILAVSIICYLVYQTLTPKPEQILNIAVVNDYFDKDQVEVFLSDLDTHFEVNSDKEKITFDSSYYVSDDDTTQNSYASIQKLTAYVYNKEIDVIISDESYFKKLTEEGYLISLNDLLPADIYTELADKYYTGAVIDEDDEGKQSSGPQKPYGIYLDDSKVYKNSGSSMEKPILGVLVNSPNKDNTVKLIKYLLE
ncbi:hypothetical protein [Anaerosporobacter sp.]